MRKSHAGRKVLAREILAEHHRIRELTRPPVDTRIPQPVSPARLEQAQFAARLLVGGGCNNLSEDSVLAMAELIVFGSES